MKKSGLSIEDIEVMQEFAEKSNMDIEATDKTKYEIKGNTLKIKKLNPNHTIYNKITLDKEANKISLYQDEIIATMKDKSIYCTHSFQTLTTYEVSGEKLNMEKYNIFQTYEWNSENTTKKEIKFNLDTKEAIEKYGYENNSIKESYEVGKDYKITDGIKTINTFQKTKK